LQLPAWAQYSHPFCEEDSMNTRRQFLQSVAGAAGGAATLPMLAEAATARRLDASFRRAANPAIAISYPSDWYFYERIVTDLIDPVQVAVVSTRPLTPSSDFSGLPNLNLFPSDAVLVYCVASMIVPGITFGNGPSIAAGVDFSEFVGGDAGDAPHGFATYVAAYQERQWAWGVYIFTGPHANIDWPTTKAIVESMRRLDG
jgi:hypothetical protein